MLMRSISLSSLCRAGEASEAEYAEVDESELLPVTRDADQEYAQVDDSELTPVEPHRVWAVRLPLGRRGHRG
jgi:hypothetical protein